MAYRRVEEAGGLPGPWGFTVGEGSSWDGWSGDEETIPLISLDEELNPGPGPVPPSTGPWNPENTNPFVHSLWTPSKQNLGLQTSLNPFMGIVTDDVNVEINTIPFDVPSEPRPFIDEKTAHTNEPSQLPRCNV